MNYGFRLFIDIAPVALFVIVISLVMVLPYRKEPAAGSLIWYLGLVCWLLASNVAELCAPAGFWTLLFAKLEYVAYVYIPVAWISFSLRYSGWIRFTKKGLTALAITGPLIPLALVMTNDFHHLIWTTIAFTEHEGFSILHADHGPLFWWIMFYCYSFIFFGAMLMLRSYVKGEKLYHRQSLWIIIGLGMPAITNLAFVTRIIPGLVKDFTPIGYALSGICFLLGMYFHRLFWIMPVSRGTILQELRTGILVLDRHGWIADHNKTLDDLFGLDVISVGRNCAEYPAIMRLCEAAKYEPGKKQVGTSSGMFELGEISLFWTLQTPDHGNDGTIFTVEDISSQIAIEKELNHLKSEFVNKDKLATVGRITAGLAHEINNPLGYLQSDVRSLERIVERDPLINGSASFREIRDITEGITEGLERIGSVIQSLLGFSRQDRADATFEIYNLHRGIDTTLEIMKYDYRKDIDIRKEYGDIPELYAQKNSINQVIFNIITNAVAAIREREGTGLARGEITIRTGMASPETVYCEIENNGVPIAEEARTRLFELFYTTKSGEWGNGIGLNLSRDIVEHRHHGKIILASCDPVVFRIELPTGGGFEA